ncbi:MAG: hypothetical protein IPL72_07470 [Sulfuritalea sp.]|nr:hypothetical protein [Sulfuritalea sp.]
MQDGRLVFTADRPYRENEGSNERTDHATGSARQVASRYSLQTDPDGTVTTAAPPPPVTGSITLADGSRLVSGNPQALNSLVGEYLGARDTFLTQHPPPPPPPPPPPVAQAPLGTNGEVVLPNGRVLEARRDANGQMRFFERSIAASPSAACRTGRPVCRSGPGTDGGIEWRFRTARRSGRVCRCGQHRGRPGRRAANPSRFRSARRWCRMAAWCSPPIGPIARTKAATSTMTTLLVPGVMSHRATACRPIPTAR